MSTKSLRYIVGKLTKYDPTAYDCAHDLEATFHAIHDSYGPLAGGFIDNAKEEVLGVAVSDDDTLRDNLLTGIREHEAYKWYAAQVIPKIDAEIAEKGHLWTDTSS